MRKSTLFSLFFLRAVRVKMFLVACKSLPPLTPPYKGGGKRAACKYLYLPSPLLTKEGERRAACERVARPNLEWSFLYVFHNSLME